jgi:hypothetical protein
MSLPMLLMTMEACRGVADHLLEHGGGQPARVRVLPRAMVAVEQEEARGERVVCAMGEGEGSSLQLEGIEDAVMRDAAYGKKGPQMGESPDPRDQELPAGGDLLWRRLVLRRHATDSVRDHAIDELKGLGLGRVVPSFGQAEFQQRAIEQLAGIVAKKRASRAVGTFEDWG